jgi:hypothetical protein
MNPFMEIVTACVVVFALSITSCEVDANERIVDLGHSSMPDTPENQHAGTAGRYHITLNAGSAERNESYGWVYVWMVHTRVEGKGRVQVIKSRMIVDCEQHSYTICETESYDKRGKWIRGGVEHEYEWRVVTAGSIIETAQHSVCD